ncbi:DNA polymerase III subunit beta [Fictibacillus nanhaiensis]|uniref:DNA polymerase III subunit beta n=1 Tax=Fictibacillus nanhaiensis TaxID=742169 RepID=UPI001C958E8B|nr:DNA polymerase III subunit beta [Fictibacillus nanhaiensis]MBY6037615.1 DNA polymerase III subunit beta [Fictibacillus nanhaiensis]
MEFIINQAIFSKALSDVGKAVSSRTLLPILSGIKIIADSDGITLIGSNADLIIKRWIPAKMEGTASVKILKPGSVVVSAKYFTELIKKLPDQIIVQANKNHSILIQSGEIRTQFNGFQADEYPTLPKLNVTSRIHINAEELMDAFKQTVFATAKSETRPVLTGVNLTFTKDKLISVATNSQRLAQKEIYIDSSTVEETVVVPSSSINELLKLIHHDSGKINIQLAEGYIQFETVEISFYSRLIAGNYPNTASLIPTDQKTTLILSKELFVKGIERACLFAGEWKNNNITLSVTDDHKLCISSGSSEMGNIQEFQEIKSIEGETELKISVDGHFILDALKTIQDPEIKLRFSGMMKPIVIESTEHDSTYVHLISPVRSY